MVVYKNELYHYGVKGMKLGVRHDKVKNEKYKYKKKYYGKDKYGNTLIYEPDNKPRILGKLIKGKEYVNLYNAYYSYTIKDIKGKKLGNLSVNEDSNDELNIVWTNTNKKAQNRGIGRQSLKIAEQQAKELGKKKVTAEVVGGNPYINKLVDDMKYVRLEQISSEDDVWGGLTKIEKRI